MFDALEPIEISFETALSAAQARDKAASVLTSRGGRIKTNDGSVLVAAFGSQLKVRLLGTILAGVQAMPRDVEVRIGGPAGTTVSVAVRDRFGFGSRFGIAQKARAMMSDDALAVKRALEAGAA